MDERNRSALSRIVSGSIQFGCPMEKYTTLRVGGKAEALCFVEDLAALQELMAYLKQE
jgi:UDP-N-acetylenolpyruvoylglucosamine reductase